MPLHSIRVWPETNTKFDSTFPSLSKTNAVAVLMFGWTLLTPAQQLAALQTKKTDGRSYGRAKPKPRRKAVAK